GIMEGQQICFSADERTHALNYVADGRILHVMDYGTNRAEKEEITEYCTTSSPFTLEGVTIGKQFHWEQQEDQTFVGSLRVIACDGELHAINFVPVEEYLKSVISSEMSATNNLELLKTHAIISRSWVLRQIACKKGAVDCNRVVANDRAVIFWDHSDHTLFDVCPDDHCQRYQGITRQVSPLVARAIEETRGMVLLDRDGQICDARFSKCCGGKSELFSSCWQDEDFHYLQPVDDPWCDTHDEQVLRLVLNDYDQRTIDFHDWQVTYTEPELTALVNRKLAAEITDFQPFARIDALIPLRVGPSGRIIELRIDGIGTLANEPKSLTICKELLIRKALSETHLYSSAFTVGVVEASANEPRKFVLTGKGWGHGVGLCQIGAANMSQHGYDFRQILAHYFIGARVESIY
ncbi:MAG: SpoIID/LytB domain-containing protein, partial [Bacteroidales bacterium]|nr:SpoIID/LytB domain-containing protein [Bacteroidales bacterium]